MVPKTQIPYITSLEHFAWHPVGFNEVACMRTSKTYERYSMLCLDEARKASDSKQRALLVEMAQEWQRLAQQTRIIVSADLTATSATSNLELDRGD